MIIVNIIGGLGNQMFQYACGRAIAMRRKQPLKLNIIGFRDYDLRKYELDCFNINATIATEKEIRLYNDGFINWINKFFCKLVRRNIFKSNLTVNHR